MHKISQYIYLRYAIADCFTAVNSICIGCCIDATNTRTLLYIPSEEMGETYSNTNICQGWCKSVPLSELCSWKCPAVKAMLLLEVMLPSELGGWRAAAAAGQSIHVVCSVGSLFFKILFLSRNFQSCPIDIPLLQLWQRVRWGPGRSQSHCRALACCKTRQLSK